MSANESFNRNDVFRQKFDKMGFNTIPIISDGKNPALKSWTEYQDKKYDGPIRSEQNLGAVLGKISGNKIVLDFDDKELGKIAFDKWNGKTEIHKSMNGGYHVIFETDEAPPKSMPLHNKEEKHTADLKGEGGIIVLPPSRIKNGNPYSIVSDVPIMKITLKELDAILKDPVFGFSEEKSKKSIEDLREPVEEGERNQNLFDYLIKLRIENPDLNESDLLDFAVSKNNRNEKPLERNEIEIITNSAFSYDLSEAQQKNLNQKTQQEAKEVIKENKELYDFAKKKIRRTIVSKSDSNQIFAKIENNNHIETIDLNTGKARSWLLFNYKQESKKLCPSDSYKNALDAIKADALFDGTTKEVIFTRIAQTGDAIYYDLCSPIWDLLKITKDGVKTIPYNEFSPTFMRKQSMNEQIKPVFENKNALEEIVKLLRINEEDRLIFKIHLVSMFFEGHQTPIMVIHGEHGSIKTTITKTVKRIVDPSASNIASLPVHRDDIPLSFSNKYLSVFDNVSELRQGVSDMFCRAITGEETTKRQLYTDADEYIFQYKRKIILNGISPRLESPDFNDRAIFYETSQIPDNERLTEEEFNQKLDELLPHILGQIFDVLSKTMGKYDKIGKIIKPFSRMGEFEKYGETISQILEYKPDEFLENYHEKWKLSSTNAIEAYPIIGLIRDLVKDVKHFEDSVANLHKKLKEDAKAGEIEIKGKESGFPSKPNRLSNQIKQLTPLFRKLGLDIIIKQYTSTDNKYPKSNKVVYITNNNFTEKQPKSLKSASTLD